MDPADAAAVLAKAASYDNRTVTESAATSWAQSINPRVTLLDALNIVIEHYGRSREWIMPADINTASDRLRRERLLWMRTPEPPAALDPDDTQAWTTWTRGYRTAVGDGGTDAEADAIADAAAGVVRDAIDGRPRPVEALVDQTAQSLPRMPKTA